MDDYRTAGLDARTVALLDYAAKVAAEPWALTADDVEAVRAAGYSDRAISDAASVCGLFSLFNRVGDGLGIELEPEMQGPGN